jgi:hypothetical protein
MREDSPAARMTPQKLGERAIAEQLNKYRNFSAHLPGRIASNRLGAYIGTAFPRG